MRRKLAGVVGALVLLLLAPAVGHATAMEVDPGGEVSATGALLGVGRPSNTQVSCSEITFTADLNGRTERAERAGARIGEIENVNENGSCSTELWFLSLDWPITTNYANPPGLGDPVLIAINEARIEVNYWFNCLFAGNVAGSLVDTDNDDRYDTLSIPEGVLSYVSGGWFCDDQIVLDADLVLSAEQAVRFV